MIKTIKFISQCAVKTLIAGCLILFTVSSLNASDYAISVNDSISESIHEGDKEEVTSTPKEDAVAAPDVQIVKGYGLNGGGTRTNFPNMIYLKCPLCCEGWGPCGTNGSTNSACHLQIQDSSECASVDLVELGLCPPCIEIILDINSQSHAKVSVFAINRYWIVEELNFDTEPGWEVVGIPIEKIVEGGLEGKKIDPYLP